MTKFKILVCEDEKDSLKSIQKSLAKRGYDVAEAIDGKEAIEQTKKIKPHLILMDIRMPKINGIEAAQEIRKFDDKVKIIFVTAFESPQISKEAAKCKISGYIVKPASPELILKSIEEALQK
jgi:CheY-like chemotaxis protein